MTFNIKEIHIILSKAFKLALKWSFWKWIATAGFGTLIGLLPILEDTFKITYTRSITFAILFVIVLYGLRFFLIFFKESLKYFHDIYMNSAYGDAIIILKETFAEAHYYRKTPGFQEEEFMKSMMVFCNNLKTIFDRITDSNCAVSIKVPVKDHRVGSDTILMNLTRNKEVKNRDTLEYTSTPHTIIGNTAFIDCWNKVITNKPKKYYINNQVNRTENYNNTSKELYVNGELPYNSELVQPIVPLKSTETINFGCHGFICIDSEKENVFKGKYDSAILEGVADGIYDLIMEKNKNKTHG